MFIVCTDLKELVSKETDLKMLLMD